VKTAHAARGFICILARPPPESSANRKGEGLSSRAKPPFLDFHDMYLYHTPTIHKRRNQ